MVLLEKFAGALRRKANGRPAHARLQERIDEPHFHQIRKAQNEAATKFRVVMMKNRIRVAAA